MHLIEEIASWIRSVPYEITETSAWKESNSYRDPNWSRLQAVAEELEHHFQGDAEDLDQMIRDTNALEEEKNDLQEKLDEAKERQEELEEELEEARGAITGMARELTRLQQQLE